MPIIGNVGRRHWRVRLLNAAIHAVLLVGGVTMVFPFLIMVSGSFKSTLDSKEFSVYPRYFVSSEVLFKKYVEARYNENTALLTETYGGRFQSFDMVVPPPEPAPQRHRDWSTFLELARDRHTMFDYYVAEQNGLGVTPRNNRRFRDTLKRECDGDLAVLNRRFGADMATWDELTVSDPLLLQRRFAGDYRGLLARYEQFKLALPLRERVYVSLDGNFVETVLKPACENDLERLNGMLGTDYASWQNVVVPSRVPEGPLGEYWTLYAREYLNLQHVRVHEDATPAYQRFLRQRHGTVESLNKQYGSEYGSFDAVPLPGEVPRTGQVLVDWAAFIENKVDPRHLRLDAVEYLYRRWLKAKYGSLAALNAAHARGYRDIESVPLPRAAPTHNLAYARDWTAFVRERADADALKLMSACRAEYVAFLSKRYPAADGGLDLGALNTAHLARHGGTEDIYPPVSAPDDGAGRRDWIDFARLEVSPRHVRVDVEREADAWHAFLRETHGTVEALNGRYGLLYTAFDEVRVDHLTNDYIDFRANRWAIFRELAGRNYVMVLDVMLYNGRAILNTLIYCLLAIATALTVNPIAAYAMSRFRLPTTYKIILVLMLTMAFPPMVMGIPNFLLLKRLNLLNTFWALVLPAAADGYFIFLLKGFFDSLPKELFECATLDGASEARIFRSVAMALSKPIMAVIALNAFNHAYRNFMLAFIVCQDHSMWTMMVHIYQLMQRSSQGVGFAALVIAAVPTFLVFVFCQKIIIRGIVVPTEK